MSQTAATADPPEDETKSAKVDTSLAPATTRAPRATKSLAVARPIPDEAPVMTTTEPCNSLFSLIDPA
jgi:hypothetical protein